MLLSHGWFQGWKCFVFCWCLDRGQSSSWHLRYCDIFIIDFNSSFHSTSERYQAEMFSLIPAGMSSLIPPMALINSSLLSMGSASEVIAIVPCPESPAIDLEQGSWLTINFHLSSWDGSIGLAPGGVSQGGSGGSSSFKVSLLLLKPSPGEPCILCRGLPS